MPDYLHLKKFLVPIWQNLSGGIHLHILTRECQSLGVKYKMPQKCWKITETLAFGYSSESTQWELSNEYLYDRV